MKELLKSIENMKRPIRYAYFDLGGVVFSFSGGLEAIAQMLNVPLPEITTYWKSQDDQICLGNLNPEQFWFNLVQNFGKTTSNFNFLDFWIDHFTPIKETQDSMRELKENGVQLGILTNIYPGVFKRAMEREIIPSLGYQSVIQSCEIGLVKPEVQIFEHALRATNFRPSEVILIDDRNENTEMAENLGWNSILFRG